MNVRLGWLGCLICNTAQVLCVFDHRLGPSQCRLNLALLRQLSVSCGLQVLIQSTLHINKTLVNMICRLAQGVRVVSL